MNRDDGRAGQFDGRARIRTPESPDAEEDDGFVLFVVHDANRDETAIEILDAGAIDAAPLARLWLDTRIPLGFHGNWAGAS